MADERPQLVKEKQKPIRVLLLDDREENLLLRSTILRQQGYEVIRRFIEAEHMRRL